MNYETGLHFYNLIKYLILDVRFQLLFGFVSLAHWAWRLPRPKKGAGNRTVFITDCDSGSGVRMARRFDAMGLHVFAGCLNPDSKGAKSLTKICSRRLHMVTMNITKEDDIKQAVAYVKANLPDGENGLYGLINTTGVITYSNLEMSTEMCEEAIAVNLMGTIRLTKHFLPLICQSQGRIVTIINVLNPPYPNTLIYTVTNHALNGFYSALRFELMDKGVHVAVIESDVTEDTNITQSMECNLKEKGKSQGPKNKNDVSFMFQERSKSHQVTLTPERDEQACKYLLEDVEDALLAEEPYWRYISVPLKKKVSYWLARNLPEEISFILTSPFQVKKYNSKNKFI